jgi:prepilin-type processing-associated H-X9-DG protein
MKREPEAPCAFTRASPRAAEPHPQGAFTRIELLSVAALLGLILLVQFPVLAGHAGKNKAMVCRANLQRLIAAWQLYAQDNQERLVLAYHGGYMANPQPNSLSRSWAAGWLSWDLAPDNTNTLYLTDPRFAALAAYGANDPGYFRCPSDDYLSKAQHARGWLRRVRSYSANIAVGDGNAENGPWDQYYLVHARKLADLVIPGPAASFVHVEEHPDSINDPAFFPPYAGQWIDLPASFHDQACHFTFADGHVELRRWRDPATTLPVKYTFYSPRVTIKDDLNWVREHTPHR